MKLFELLGVAGNATDHEIRAAYRRIALRCHPDRAQGNPEAEALFHEATEAYRLLTHPERRRQYEIESGPVDSVADLFERKRIGKRLLRALLPAARNAPRAGRTRVRAVSTGQPGVAVDAAGKMTLARGGADPREPLRIGQTPEWASPFWYELEGQGEPGRNGGEPGTLWLMIIDKGEKDGA